MKIRKSDWSVANEAEMQGLLVSMTNIVSPKRTEQNNFLNTYFSNEMPEYRGIFDEDVAEDVLFSLNEFRKKDSYKKKGYADYNLDFPLTSGSDVHLIPITDNLQLRVLIVDEYLGDGEYSKYIEANSFIINENARERDVDELVQFVKEYLVY